MKRSKNIPTVVLLLVMLFSLTSVKAQHDHSSHGQKSHQGSVDSAPNGGVLKEAGKYHIEMIVDRLVLNDQLTFYLYKGNMKLVSNEGISGSAIVKYKDGTVNDQNLKAIGDSRFIGQLSSPQSFTCTIEFVIKEKIVTTVFQFNGTESSTSITYSCPMHSEVKSEKPGKCPVCGMNLTQ